MHVVLSALMLLCVAEVVGAQQDVPRAYEAVRSSVSYREAVAGIYESYERSLSTHCSKVEVNMNTSEAKVMGPFQTDANGAIVSGHWKETSEGTACGEKRLYNASVMVQDGKSQVLSLLPGHSYAGAVLQRDAVEYAAIGASAGTQCSADILDTALPDGEPVGPHDPWVEKWTVRACGKRSLVTMRFAPDASGTTINVTPKETVLLP